MATDEERLFDTRDFDESPEPDDSDSEDEEEEDMVTEEDQPAGDEDEGKTGEHTDKGSTNSTLMDRTLKLLEKMEELNLSPANFLVAMSWGDDACNRNSKIQAFRRELLHSSHLPGVIRRWWKPPRLNMKKRRPEGATTVLKEFALETVENVLNTELEKLAPDLQSPKGVDVEKETLQGTTLANLSANIKEKAPCLWRVLRKLACRRSQDERNTRKDPDWVVLTVVSIFSYSRSHHRCRLQKLLAIYLKFKGISAKGFDTLHSMGLTMSHKWTCNAVERISQTAMDNVRELIKFVTFFLSYDNMSVPMRIFSQQIDNSSSFADGNGSAATVYLNPKAPPLSENANKNLRQSRAEGMLNPLTEKDVLRFADDSMPRIQRHMVDHVLHVLLDSPDFEFRTYEGRHGDILKPPPSIKQLPTGPDHITLQYLLGSVNIPEASYEDNEHLLDEWFDQLGWRTPGERMKIAMKKVVTMIGDQLTIDRLRGLFKFHAEDDNSLDRLDFSVFTFGWFHAQMAFANSLHKQFLGTDKGRGLKQAFELLGRKGLTKVQTKGPFHHDLDEALHVVADAHLREDWLQAGNVKKLSDLRDRPAEELLHLALRIVEKRASNEALDDMAERSEKERDEMLEQTILWNRDVLQYIVLGEAISRGDIGLVEDMIPHLFLRFTGSGNGRYAGEMLELLQSLHREWDQELADFIRNNCWLINTTGKPGQFCPIDRAQEHNIKDIKVTYRSEGPNVKWEYLKKLHPAIHVIRAVAEHVEQEFGTNTRGKKHGVPSGEKDVWKLQESYRAAECHVLVRGRKIKTKQDKAEDYVMTGGIKLHKKGIFRKWVHLRMFKRAVSEMWDHMVQD